VIVLDTTILVYALGDEHRLRDPSRRLIEAIGDGRVQATTTVEAAQEFVHVRARRRDRADAVQLGLAYSDLLAPLIQPGREDLEIGLGLFERHTDLGAFDSVLAAAAMARDADALPSPGGWPCLENR
jgi:uncharacterized protein